MKALRESRCIRFYTLALEGAEGSASRPGRFLSVVQEAGWAPEAVWTGGKNLAPTGIRSRTVQPISSHSTGLINVLLYK
jgi:hypothetical protein